MKEELGIRNVELRTAFQDLLRRGLVRPTGKYRNGRMVYEWTPYAEQSDEAKAYDAYLKSLSGDTQVN